jgi:hypothetical protein
LESHFWNKIKPLVIFKGKHGTTIARHIAAGRIDLPDELGYTVQFNSWADEDVMHHLGNNILGPYVQE